MIHFEEDTSIYNKRNKEYILSLQEQLKNFQFEGECNSFGYNVLAKSHDFSQTKIQLKKTQYAGKGLSTHYNYEVVFNFNISNNRIELQIGKSKIKRLFLSSNLKNKVVSPYFVKFNNLSEEKISKIFEFVQSQNISSVYILNGKVEIKIFQKTENPLEILKFFQEENYQ